jgi:hypothetical protein
MGNSVEIFERFFEAHRDREARMAPVKKINDPGAVRDQASGRFVSASSRDSAWNAFDQIYELRKDAPSKLADLFRVHKDYQSKRG